MKNKNESNFEIFLKKSISADDFENIPKILGISKRMFTFILREPSKLELTQALQLSKLMGQSIESISKFIEA